MHGNTENDIYGLRNANNKWTKGYSIAKIIIDWKSDK